MSYAILERRLIRDKYASRSVAFGLVFSVLCIAPPARGQQAPAEQPHPTTAQQASGGQATQQGSSTNQKNETKQEQKNTIHEEATGTSNDRLFFTLPNFLTVENASHVPPLTAKDKYKVVARSSFDYVEYPWYGFLAGVSQAENSEPGYGQGAAGYGKRFGAAFGDGAIENFWVGAVLPGAFHQDPRFYQLGRGGFRHRTLYAVSRIFVTRTDSGHETFNVSEIFGSAIAAGISTYSYHPRADRTLPNTASVWGSSVGYDTITLVVKEFWPDIRRKIRGTKEQTATKTDTDHSGR